MDKPLWKPSEDRARQTNLYRFMQKIRSAVGEEIADYAALHRWSVRDLPAFWAAVWDFVQIKADRRFESVVDDPRKLPGARWFEGARLNFACNLLRYRDDHVALVARCEGRPDTQMTYAELHRSVARLVPPLRACGVGPGDRVAALMPNIPETVVAMLAATSLGAVWSSCSPDFGIRGVLDRFGQIEPKVLFVSTGYLFRGKTQRTLDRFKQILHELPSVERVIVVPYPEPPSDLSGIAGATDLESFLAGTSEASGEIEFASLPANHPLYIMFTSGTTGRPKCMVQSAGGVLLNQLKELVLHTDLTRDDTLFYFTTCGWMMWNWLVSGLAVGATLVLYDGHPFHPNPGALWAMAQDLGISIFGTSAGYLAALEAAGVKPGRQYDLTRLRTVLSTGSPLLPASFEYVYRDISPDVQLASISGGSDINGCFAGGNPMGPVYAGELQCLCLGMDVHAFDARGKSVINQQGELVCAQAAPSMPLSFWDDPQGARYRAAYFDHFPGVWRHGDFIEVNDRGGVTMYGRSDATLNPGGVRIGTAEIYRLVEGLPEIADSLVVGQRWRGDTRMLLFVQLASGAVLDDPLKTRIIGTLRSGASPRHVPAEIRAVPDIPYTHNMKKVEVAVRQVIDGEAVVNRDALRNPEVLDHFAAINWDA